MPIALLIVGVMFIVAAVRGTQGELFSTVKSDFTGPNNFIYWGLAIFLISALGYWKPAKPLSNAFLLLVLVVIFLSNKGFFNSFLEQVRSTGASSSNKNNYGSHIRKALDTLANNGPGSQADPISWNGSGNAPGKDGEWISIN